MGVNLVRPDWQGSGQDTVSLRTDIRYSEVTKMSNVIEKYVCYVIIEKNKVGVSPRWASCPTLPWWRHQMETFSALLAICAGNSPVPVNSPHKGQWRRALMFSLICVWINDWTNNREAGDLRRYRGHYDVTVMTLHVHPVERESGGAFTNNLGHHKLWYPKY